MLWQYVGIGFETNLSKHGRRILADPENTMLQILRKWIDPNQACLWGSYSNERILVRVGREGGSPVMQGNQKDLGTKILVPRSWYQDLWGNRSWVTGGPPSRMALTDLFSEL